MDKGIDMDPETDAIVGNMVHTVVIEEGEAIKITIITIAEIIDLEIPVMGTIKETIGIMTGQITEGITSIKDMAKDIDTEV